MKTKINALNSTEQSGADASDITAETKGTKRGAHVAMISGQGPMTGVDWDFVGFAFPDDVTEVRTYYVGGSGGTLVATMTIIYVDSDKCVLVSIEVVKP